MWRNKKSFLLVLLPAASGEYKCGSSYEAKPNGL